MTAAAPAPGSSTPALLPPSYTYPFTAIYLYIYIYRLKTVLEAQIKAEVHIERVYIEIDRAGTAMVAVAFNVYGW